MLAYKKKLALKGLKEVQIAKGQPKPSLSSKPDQVELYKESGTSSLNPFCIELILETLFAKLPYSTLETCFSVSGLWRRKAFDESKSRSIIFHFGNLGSQPSDAKSMHTRLAKHELHKLVTLMAETIPLDQPIMYKNLRLLSPFLHTLLLPSGLDGPQSLGTVLKELPNLKVLLLSPLTKDRMANQEPLLPIYDPQTFKLLTFDNIRRLEVNCRNGTKRDDFGPTICLSSILKSFPKLVTLMILNLLPEDPKNFKGLSTASLRHLRICPSTSQDIEEVNGFISLLLKLDLNLSRLQFRFEKPQAPPKGKLVDVDLLRKFIESQRDTLKCLDLIQVQMVNMEFEACHDPNVCPFPLNLPNLTSLFVQKPFMRNLNHIINFLPSLKELKFSVPPNYNWKGILPVKLNVHPNVEVLRMDNMDTSTHELLMAKCFNFVNMTQILAPDFEAGKNAIKGRCPECGEQDLKRSMDLLDHIGKFDWIITLPSAYVNFGRWYEMVWILGTCGHRKRKTKTSFFTEGENHGMGFQNLDIDPTHMVHWLHREAIDFQSVHYQIDLFWRNWGNKFDEVFVPFHKESKFVQHKMTVDS